MDRSASTESSPLITSESKLRRNPQVVARELAEGAVLLHLVTGQYHGVNPIGLAIWELIDDGCTVADVTDRLRERVEAPPPQLADDVVQFLSDVQERDLVVVEQ